MRRFLSATLVLAAVAVTVPTLGASAGPAPAPEDIDVSLVSHTEPLTFSADIGVDIECASVTVTTVEANGTEVTPLAVVPDGTDPNVVFITLPSDTPPGTLFVAAECEYDGTIFAEGSEEWAALAVTKVVDGGVPDDATFTVHVDCSGTVLGGDVDPAFIVPGPFAVDLEYDAAGGVHYVYFDTGADCTITEPVDGGATATTIDPDHVAIDDPDPFTSTVTNTFPVEVQPAFTG